MTDKTLPPLTSWVNLGDSAHFSVASSIKKD